MNLTDGLDGLAIGTVADRGRRVHRRSPTSPATASSPSTCDLLLPARGGRADGLLRRAGRARRRLPLVELLPGRRSSWATWAASRSGGALGTVAILIKQELLLFLVGGLFVIEALSVILQVASFKLHRQAHLPHGAAPPPLRARRLEGAADHHPLLDRRLHLRALQPHDAEAAVSAGRHGSGAGSASSWSGWRGRGDRGGARSSRGAARASWPPTGSRESELPPEALALRERRRARSSSAAHRRGDASPARDSSSSRPACRWELAELEAARGAGVPVIGEIELAFALAAGPRGRDHRHEGQVHDHRRARRDAARGRAATRASAATSARRSAASSRARRAATALRGRGLELPARGHRHASARTWPCCLNLSPDHLDRHPTLEAYAAAKARIFANQRPEDWAVVNADDPAVLGRGAPRARARSCSFRVDRRAARRGRRRLLRGRARPGCGRTGAWRRSSRAATSSLPGAHLAGDLLVAAAAARAAGRAGRTRSRARCAASAASSTCSSTWPTIGGVAFVNDSKATNVEAARRSLEAFDAAGASLILGGRYKGGDFGELAPAAARATAGASLAIGEARERVARGARGTVPVERAARRCGDAVRARARRGRARRRRPARPGLLLLRHVPRLRRARPRVQGRGRGASARRGGGSRG